MCPSNVTIMVSSVCVHLAVLGVVSAGVWIVKRQYFGTLASISDQVSQERVLRIFHIPITQVASFPSTLIVHVLLWMFTILIHHAAFQLGFTGLFLGSSLMLFAYCRYTNSILLHTFTK